MLGVLTLPYEGGGNGLQVLSRNHSSVPALALVVEAWEGAVPTPPPPWILPGLIPFSR